MQNLIITSLDAKNNGEKYEPNLIENRKRSKKPMKILEAATRFLEYHYYQQNPEKWLTVFHNQSNFFNSLKRTSRRVKYPTNYERFLKNCFPNISSVELIPWSMPISLTEKQQRIVMQLHRRSERV
ncbi:hypothetical protein PGTUg99_015954 [Puccinia graminis f. sp. tritici]|nr:hypothetical protein PGTUg99_015954 [Puccinia graminis f. sp. tritici]